MTDEAEKTFTQADIDNLKAEHQKAIDILAGKLRAEFKVKETKPREEAEKLTNVTYQINQG